MEVAIAYVLLWVPVLCLYGYRYPAGRVRVSALSVFLLTKALGSPSSAAMVLTAFPVRRQTRKTMALAALGCSVAYALACPMALVLACTFHALGPVGGSRLASCLALSWMLHYSDVSMVGPLSCFLLVVKHQHRDI